MFGITTSVCTGYYDLIETPSGHTPAPWVSNRFWLRFVPLPIGKVRDNDFYECPNCGRKSFFKIYRCYCGHAMNWTEDESRNSQKNLEINNLFILSLLGKAKYIKSDRIHIDSTMRALCDARKGFMRVYGFRLLGYSFSFVVRRKVV